MSPPSMGEGKAGMEEIFNWWKSFGGEERFNWRKAVREERFNCM